MGLLQCLADFALPLGRYFKGVNGSVDLAMVTYRIYGPDVTNPPSKELVKAAETVMQGMYEGFCNISAFVVAANSTPTPPQIRNPAGIIPFAALCCPRQYPVGGVRLRHSGPSAVLGGACLANSLWKRSSF
jgi:hypothetical protein